MEKYEFIGKSLWFPMEKVLAIADLHIGYEDALINSGVFLPKEQFERTISDLKKIFSVVGKVKEVIINGDFKHEFGKILEQEWSESLKILDFLQENSGKVVLIRGNHDKILEPIARKRGMVVVDSYIKNEICFMHGDKDVLLGREPEHIALKKIKMIVMGHKHPSVVISDNYKQEKYKCFLVGKWKGKKTIILPSFFPLIEGVDISKIEEGEFIIPDAKLSGFEVYAVGDKVYHMGKVRDIGRLI